MEKISICTVCMNRLSHLKETLPANIIDNEKYPNIEFVVLDYNSKDEMESWAKTNLKHYIESGIVKYYKTTDRDHFYMSHSKNMALRLSSGDIVCLIDADIFTGANYAEWVHSTFSTNGKPSVLTTLRLDKIYTTGDLGGKLCIHRDLVHAVNGFDESLIGHGIDDIDLVNRLEKAGGKRIFIEDREFLKFIAHSNEERLKNHHLINNLESLYLHISGTMNKETRVLYLLSDHTFHELNCVFDETKIKDVQVSHAGWTIVDQGHVKGSFTRSGDELTLIVEDRPPSSFREVKNGQIIQSCNDKKPSYWKKVSPNEPLHLLLAKGFGECINRLKYKENDEKDLASVNPGGWGKGTVYLNFDSTPILIN
jgi:GT2 family glycosyltransferase